MTALLTIAMLIPAISGLADNRLAMVDAPSASRSSSAKAVDAPPSFFVRLSIGGMSTAPSAQRELLARDGFPLGAKYAAQLDGAYMIRRWIGAGFWAGLTYQSATERGVPPSVTEKCLFVGLQAPLMWTVGDVALLAIPRVGAASADLYVSSGGRWITGLAAGGEVGLFSVKTIPFLGMSIGGLWAPVGEPGGVARAHNAGGLYFLVSGVLHD